MQRKGNGGGTGAEQPPFFYATGVGVRVVLASILGCVVLYHNIGNFDLLENTMKTITEQALKIHARADQIKGQGMMQQAAKAPELVEDITHLLVQMAFQVESLTATNRNLNNRLEKIEPYVDEDGET